MAIASASAASGDFGSAFGSRIFSITRIWFLSAWPAPTTVFFTWFGRVFRDRDPEHRRRQHRNAARLAELQRGDAVLVDKGLFDRGLRRGESRRARRQAPHGSPAGGSPAAGLRRFHRAAADEDQPVAVDLDHAPAGAAQARIDAKDADGLANRLQVSWGSLTPRRMRRSISVSVISDAVRTRPIYPPILATSASETSKLA